MRTFFLGLALALFVLMQAGCAAGFHAGGSRAGAGAGAAVGPSPAYETPSSR
jgi:hypothetical protein